MALEVVSSKDRDGYDEDLTGCLAGDPSSTLTHALAPIVERGRIGSCVQNFSAEDSTTNHDHEIRVILNWFNF